MSKAILQELKELNKEKGSIFGVSIYRHFSIRITSLLIQHTNIEPNLVTVFTVILAFVAAIFFFKGDYVSLIIGALFLNLSYIFDCVDGELARYKKLNSQFGAWLDGVCDRISEYMVITGLTFGFYFKTMNPTVLILGFFTIFNLMMIAFIRSQNRVFFDIKPKHEFRFFGKYYLGRSDFIVVLITVTAVLNQIYYFLIFFTVLGTVIWIRQIYKKIMVHYKS